MIASIGERYPKGLLWGTLVAFMALNTVMLWMEIYYIPLIPAALLFIALALVSVDKYLLTLLFFVPLSIPLSVLAKGLSVDMFLPTEPLLAGLLLLYIIKYLMGDRVDIRVLRHPVTLAIYFQLAWMLITAITSTDPLVSFKALASRPGHVKSRDQLMDAAYGESIYVDDRTIDSHIKRLRKKFRQVDNKFSQIETLYGVGYRYSET